MKSVKTPAQSPNCNPYAERFVETIKYECLNNFVILGERHLRYLIKEFIELRIERARTTRDIDLRLVGSADNILTRLQEAGRLDLGDFMTFEIAPDDDHPEMKNGGMIYEGLRFRAECRLAGKLYGQRFGVDVAVADPILGQPEVILSIKAECLERMVLLEEWNLRRAISEYMRHYHGERNHQGLEDALIDGIFQDTDGLGRVARRERLGGLLSFYYREAA